MKKLRIRIGGLEVEMETDDLKGDLEIVRAFADGLSPPEAPQADPQRGPRGDVATPASIDKSMDSYVSALSADSARKILQAASYHLTLSEGKDAFSKDELFAKARESRDWRADYSNQQAINLSRMVKAGELTHRANGSYSVPRKHIDAARQKLADE